MKKSTFKHSLQKKLAREEVFKKLKKKSKLIGLAGPDMRDYLEFVQKHGYKDISVWENDRQTFLTQMFYDPISGLKVFKHFGDIINAPVEKDTFYDLDFCGTVSSIKQHIIKFKDCAAVYTISLRDNKGRTMDDQIDLFLAYRGELRKTVQWNENQAIVIAHNDNKFGLYKYVSESNMVMLMIYNL